MRLPKDNAEIFQFWRFPKLNSCQYNRLTYPDINEYLYRTGEIYSNNCNQDPMIIKKLNEDSDNEEDPKYDPWHWALLGLVIMVKDGSKYKDYHLTTWAENTLTLQLNNPNKKYPYFEITRIFDGYSHPRLFGLELDDCSEIRLSLNIYTIQDHYPLAMYVCGLVDCYQILKPYKRRRKQITNLSAWARGLLDILQYYPISQTLKNYMELNGFWCFPDFESDSNLLIPSFNYFKSIHIQPNRNKYPTEDSWQQKLKEIKCTIRGYMLDTEPRRIVCMTQNTTPLVHLPVNRCFFIHGQMMTYDELGFDSEQPYWNQQELAQSIKENKKQ